MVVKHLKRTGIHPVNEIIHPTEMLVDRADSISDSARDLACRQTADPIVSGDSPCGRKDEVAKLFPGMIGTSGHLNYLVLQ